MIYLMIYLLGFFPALYIVTKSADSSDSNSTIFWLTVIWPLSLLILLFYKSEEKLKEIDNPLYKLIDKWRNK